MSDEQPKIEPLVDYKKEHDELQGSFCRQYPDRFLEEMRAIYSKHILLLEKRVRDLEEQATRLDRRISWISRP